MLAHCLLILEHHRQQSPSDTMKARAYHESLAQGIKPLLKRFIVIDRFLFAQGLPLLSLSLLSQILIELYQRCPQERTVSHLHSPAVPRSLP